MAMQFNHIAWRTERADIGGPRPVGVEVVSEQPGTLTIIGRGTSSRQAFRQVEAEAMRQGLPVPQTDGLGQSTDRDVWCAVTWL